MSRIQPIDPARATGKAAELLSAVQKKLGVTPNMMRTMASSPAVLDAYLAFSGALAGGSLSAKLREQIAVTVAEANRCDYCLAAHHAIGARVGLSPRDLELARSADAADAKAKAVLVLARAVAKKHGEVSDADVASARAAGLSDGELAEVVANVALNAFTNSFNHFAATEVDFPAVSPALAR
ncbi:MAG: carboxymuconolactone decarboxylase family protein [Planctomycetota bacterium]|nr:MAG: carboxymuconolactone decarboxylase family protein [Planctomycetota bacterium]